MSVLLIAEQSGGLVEVSVVGPLPTLTIDNEGSLRGSVIVAVVMKSS